MKEASHINKHQAHEIAYGRTYKAKIGVFNGWLKGWFNGEEAST